MHTRSRSSLLFFLAVLAPLAAAEDIAWSVCGQESNYTAGSTYQANLNTLAAGLPKNASSSATLFATGSAGSLPDRVYALTLCRGDTNASACLACATQAFQDAQQLCPHDRDASIYYDPCLLRFSNQNIFPYDRDSSEFVLGAVKDFTGAKFPGWDPGNSTSIAFFSNLVAVLLNDTAQAAANSTRRFATAQLDVSDSNSVPLLYSLSQCTPDLSAAQCLECLRDDIHFILTEFRGSRGVRGLSARCTHRYDVYRFYDGNPMLRILSLTGPAVPAGNSAPPPPPMTFPAPPPVITAGEQRNGSKKKLWIIGIVVPLLAILTFFIFCTGRIHRSRKGKLNSQEQFMVNFNIEEVLQLWRIEEDSTEFTLFDFSEIVDATSNFSHENKLGQGGFGPVYKGRLSDGLEIAVKRLASHSGQGLVEFKNEIQLIAKLQHTNLVRLLGCCIQGEEKILIYEYMPNKSLDFFIFDVTKGALLDWNKRLNIIEGIAQGLLYLHKHSRLRVIHRDLKASNILLDYDMNPKISDFGLAKIFGSNDIEGNTNRIVGTFGYMAPEYACEGLFSMKSDVFSFGVLLLEIVNGKRNGGFHQHEDFLNLIGYAWQLWKEGRWLELVDALLVNECKLIEIMRCTHIALLCVQENAADRPTMSDVVVMLNSEGMSLPEPKQPAYFNVRVAPNVEPCSINDVTITAEDGR